MTGLRRRTLLAAWLALPTAPALAQQTPREIGFLHPGTPAAATFRLSAFAEGLRQQGFVEGRTVTVVARWAAHDPAKLGAAIEEFIKRGVSIITAVGRPAVVLAHGASTTIPIVALDLESDPVQSGFIKSLSRPGGNLTGLFFDFPEFSGKLLQLLGETVPRLERIGVLWDPTSGVAPLETLSALAEARGLHATTFRVGKPDDIEAAVGAARQWGMEAAIALSSPVVGTEPTRLARAALHYRLPIISSFPEYGEAGGLMAYGVSVADLFRQAGEIVGKLLAGAPPADLPVERPSRFRLVVNLTTARTLGLKLPEVLLARADDVLE
jgi:putative tryptophan/tyrosine transport system substrate-binding protein